MKKDCTIGIDARFFAEAGPGRYIKNIIEFLPQVDKKNKYVVFLREKGYQQFNPQASNFKKYLTHVKWYTWQEQSVFLYQLLSQNLDLLYVPHFNIPVFYPGKIVTAIPDIIMNTYSTDANTTLPKPYFNFKKYVYGQVLKIALQRSNKVIVPTYDVYNDITNNYTHIDKNKFVVSYEGIDPVFNAQVTNTSDFQVTLKSFGLKAKNYLLFISGMRPHKNVEGLIKAFKLIRQKYNWSGKLVLIGKRDFFSEKYAKLIKQENLENEIIMPGMTSYVSDTDLVAYRKNCLLYVFPSFKEGFSLTPLEAQAVGTPCVISNISCHREVYGDSVVYFDPYNVENIAETIYKTMQDSNLRESLINAGYAQVKKYNWLDTTKTTVQVFNETLSC